MVKVEIVQRVGKTGLEGKTPKIEIYLNVLRNRRSGEFIRFPDLI
jgi:hypothetical protein